MFKIEREREVEYGNHMVRFDQSTNLIMISLLLFCSSDMQLELNGAGMRGGS
jgi:hypothetical protein